MYINGTLNHGIWYTPGALNIYAYSYSYWVGSPIDRTSTSGYIIYLGMNPISWQGNKQSTVSRLSTKSEYRSLAHTSAKLSWTINILEDLHVPLYQAPVIHCDNISAMSIAHNPVCHVRIKHIKFNYHLSETKLLSNYFYSATSALPIRLQIYSPRVCQRISSLT